jgi:hypothetical protein
MASSNLIYEPSVGAQNADNCVYNQAVIYNATNNAVVTGNTFKYKSDRERMQALLGSKGTSRTTGYYPGVVARFYPITVTNPTLPSINGPGSSGWGTQAGNTYITNVIYLGDADLQARAGLSNYVGVVVSGYLYSPIATTAQFQTTSDDGNVVIFNATTIISAWAYQAPTTTTSAVVTVNAGYNPFVVRYFEGTVTALLSLQIKLGNGPFTNDLSCICYYGPGQL